jgi:hypothetical protein
MSDQWQPARLKLIHDPHPSDAALRANGKIVRVRPIEGGKEHGFCDAPRYEWHPDDAMALLGANYQIVICAHEIETD